MVAEVPVVVVLDVLVALVPVESVDMVPVAAVSVMTVPVVSVDVIGVAVELEPVVAELSVTTVLLVSLLVVESSFLQPKAKRTRAVTQSAASVFFICSSLFRQTSAIPRAENAPVR